jgi:hypothetical protein
MASSATPAGPESPPRVAPHIAAWLLHESSLRILREVVTACDAAAIPVMPVKGVVTSRVLYADVAERPITDIDVRIRARDFGRLRQLAASLRWPCLRVARTYLNLIYDFDPLSLDVEGTVGAPGLCALDVETMLGRSRRRAMAPNLWISVPEIHDHAIVLTVNAFKDKIVTAPRWAIDDLERIVLQPEFDSRIFADRVFEARIATIAWIVAGWMESARVSDAWGAIRRLIEARGRLRRVYARWFIRGLASTEGASLSFRLLARAGADSPLMQAGALACAAAWSAEMWLRGDPRMRPRPRGERGGDRDGEPVGDTVRGPPRSP